MKTAYSFLRRSFAAFMVTMGLVTAGYTTQAQTGNDVSPETRTEVERLNHDIEKAFEKKDMAAIVDLYADDATIIAPGGKKVQGRKAIAEFWYAMANAKSIKSEITELGGNAKMLYQVGKWSITKVENGVEKIVTTDIVLVWKRESNYTYKIQLNSSNNPVATTGSPVESFEAAKP
jgi:ketosteroid isomerase-like protein